MKVKQSIVVPDGDICQYVIVHIIWHTPIR